MRSGIAPSYITILRAVNIFIVTLYFTYFNKCNNKSNMYCQFKNRRYHIAEKICKMYYWSHLRNPVSHAVAGVLVFGNSLVSAGGPSSVLPSMSRIDENTASTGDRNASDQDKNATIVNPEIGSVPSKPGESQALAGLLSVQDYFKELDLEEDQLEELGEERDKVIRVWREVVGEERGMRAEDTERFEQLLTALGTTYCEEEHGSVLPRLSQRGAGAESDRMMELGDFMRWYLGWLFANDDDEEEEEGGNGDGERNSSEKTTSSAKAGGWSSVKWSVAPSQTAAEGVRWKCNTCMVMNEWGRAKCQACERAAPHADTLKGVTASAMTTATAEVVGTAGSVCGNQNQTGASSASSSSISSSGFSFGFGSASQSPGSLFGVSSKPLFGAPSASTSTSGSESLFSGGFVFGNTLVSASGPSTTQAFAVGPEEITFSDSKLENGNHRSSRIPLESKLNASLNEVIDSSTSFKSAGVGSTIASPSNPAGGDDAAAGDWMSRVKQSYQESNRAEEKENSTDVETFKEVELDKISQEAWGDGVLQLQRGLVADKDSMNPLLEVKLNSKAHSCAASHINSSTATSDITALSAPARVSDVVRSPQTRPMTASPSGSPSKQSPSTIYLPPSPAPAPPQLAPAGLMHNPGSICSTPLVTGALSAVMSPGQSLFSAVNSNPFLSVERSTHRSQSQLSSDIASPSDDVVVEETWHIVDFKEISDD